VLNARGGKKSRMVLPLFVAGALVSTACADPIAPSYSVTNLGPGTITLSASNGTAVPVDPNSVSYGVFGNALSGAVGASQISSVSNGGTAYPFTFTPATPLSNSQVNSTDFPLAVSAPVYNPLTYGIPLNAYSITLSPFVNANGTAVAIDSAGIFGHFGSETAYSVQRNADGSWGQPSVIWYGNQQQGEGPIVSGVTIAGINSQNQVVGTMSLTAANPLNNAVMYDINTHTLTNLSTLPALAGYLNVLPVAIDDLGRILVEASPVAGGPEQSLLLTPAGVSSDPLAVPAPEPGSFAVMALAMAAFALNGIRESRRRR
jgi:hypothetical protein